MGDAIFTRRFSQGEKIPFYELSINPTTIDATLTNFPVMVRTTSTNYNMSLFTDSNVYFTDEDKNLLDFEVEYATTSERIYHVKLPSVSSTIATKFRLYFDGAGQSNGRNATSVWDSNYLAVWHFTTLNNSANSNNNLAVGGSSAPTLVTTTLGKARDFNHNNAQWYQVAGGNSYSLLNDTSYTIGVIATLTARNSHQRFYTQGRLSGTRNSIYIGTSPNSAAINGSAGTLSTSLSSTELRMWHFAGTNSGSSSNYFNGAFSLTLNSWLTGGSSAWSNSGTRIGRQFNPYSEYWDGLMGEIRISNIVRSAAWIKAEYYTLFNTMINNVTLK